MKFSAMLLAASAFVLTWQTGVYATTFGYSGVFTDLDLDGNGKEYVMTGNTFSGSLVVATSAPDTSTAPTFALYEDSCRIYGNDGTRLWGVGMPDDGSWTKVMNQSDVVYRGFPLQTTGFVEIALIGGAFPDNSNRDDFTLSQFSGGGTYIYTSSTVDAWSGRLTSFAVVPEPLTVLGVALGIGSLSRYVRRRRVA